MSGLFDAIGPAPGRRIGPYLVVAQLGQGGMGTVWRAQGPGGTVALKLTRCGATPAAARRFRTETKVLGRLRHPNLVAVRDAGVDEWERAYLAMDLVEGPSLEQRLEQEGSLPVEEAARLVATLAHACAYAHAQGVLHRDIKPANVLLRAGEPLLTDFGLAKDLDASISSPSVAGQFLGTPAYWPPEQARGDLGAIGPPADVYGLGALLFACLTARPPFEGQSLVELIAATLGQEPDPPSALRPEIPGALDALCLRCLAKDPAARPPTPAALAAELEALLADGLAATPPDATRSTAAAELQPRTSSGARWAVAAAVVLLLGVAASLLAVGWGEAAPSGTPPVAPPLAPTSLAAEVRDLMDVDEPAALARLDEVLATPRATAELYGLRAQIHARHARWGEAIADLDGALALDPADGRLRGVRALCHLQAGDPKRARADALAAAALAPARANCWAVLAQLELLGGRNGVAAGYARQALASAPDHIVALQVLGSVGERAERLEVAERLVELQPGANSLVILGKTRQDAGQHARAREAFDRALALSPDHPVALMGRSQARQELGDVRGAIADMKRAAELRDSADGWQLLGHLAITTDPALARVAYSRCIALAPKNFMYWVYRGNARMALGDLVGAIADCDEAHRLAPYSQPPLALSATACLRAGDYEAAVERYTRAIERAPHDGTTILNRANARFLAGDYEGALEDYERALAEREGAVDLMAVKVAIHYGRGRTLERLGRPGEAADALAEVLRLAPRDPRRAQLQADIARLRGEAR